MSEWQSVETAPSDGRRIIVYRPFTGRVEQAEADGEHWRYERRRGHKAPPTHWMALPSPPEDAQ